MVLAAYKENHLIKNGTTKDRERNVDHDCAR